MGSFLHGETVLAFAFDEATATMVFFLCVLVKLIRNIVAVGFQASRRLK
jgi:hypothetical protein